MDKKFKFASHDIFICYYSLLLLFIHLCTSSSSYSERRGVDKGKSWKALNSREKKIEGEFYAEKWNKMTAGLDMRDEFICTQSACFMRMFYNFTTRSLHSVDVIASIFPFLAHSIFCILCGCCQKNLSSQQCHFLLVVSTNLSLLKL